MCKFFNSYEEFPSEFALFPQNFTQLGKILQDRRSQGPDKYQVCSRHIQGDNQLDLDMGLGGNNQVWC